MIRDNPEIFPKNKSETSLEFYKDVMRNKTMYPTYIVGYFGFALSYGGKFFGGWCRDSEDKRDYIKEAYDNALKQSSKLKNIKFKTSSYENLNFKDKSIIYCDPPYNTTTQYKDKFDHVKFWAWCREQTKTGHKVLVSEYIAPDDFVPVFEKEQVSSLTQNTGAKIGIEKLFVHESFINRR